MSKRRILIVDGKTRLRMRLSESLREAGCTVVIAHSRAKALRRHDLDRFDVIISHSAGEAGPEAHAGNGHKAAAHGRRRAAPRPGLKLFSVSAANFLRLRPGTEGELRDIVERTLECKLRFDDELERSPVAHERIEFELPSDLSLMNGVLLYLHERVTRVGIINPERSNLFIALDEAFVNAIKHGNKYDARKLIRVSAEIDARAARFVVEDEGEGFNVAQIPDPREPANLFKTSGRGVLLIYNIMDEVMYNERGNRLTMIKKRPAPETPEPKPFEQFAPDDRLARRNG